MKLLKGKPVKPKYFERKSIKYIGIYNVTNLAIVLLVGSTRSTNMSPAQNVKF